MSHPLVISEAQLRHHFVRVEEVLQQTLDTRVQPRITADWATSPVVGGLSGSGCEVVERNRGARGWIAPFVLLGNGMWAWVGYREEWADEGASAKGRRRLTFRSSSITIHFGWKNDAFKPQMFRAEWAGWAKWDGVRDSFQAANAGHPHWQFDALQSLLDESASQRAELLRKLLNEDGDPEIREFGGQFGASEVRDAVSVQELDRVHFASAAAWWEAPPNNRHAHIPRNPTDIQEWTRCALKYLENELERLQTG